MSTITATDQATWKTTLVKVPQITAIFWAMKIVTTGMGEAASDLFLGTSFGLWDFVGVIVYAVLCTGIYAVAIHRQLRTVGYHAPTYWFAVSMVAVFGTLLADLMHVAGLSFLVVSGISAVAVAALLALWHRSEGTLSIHSIVSGRREYFYWATVLATFSLGTAVGDLTAETLHLGFFLSGVLFTVAMTVPLLTWRLGINPVAAFWAAYVLTRPLGASFADWLAKPSPEGAALGQGAVTAVAVALLVALVAYVARTRADAPPALAAQPGTPGPLA